MTVQELMRFPVAKDFNTKIMSGKRFKQHMIDYQAGLKRRFAYQSKPIHEIFKDQLFLMNRFLVHAKLNGMTPAQIIAEFKKKKREGSKISEKELLLILMTCTTREKYNFLRYFLSSVKFLHFLTFEDIAFVLLFNDRLTKIHLQLGNDKCPFAVYIFILDLIY